MPHTPVPPVLLGDEPGSFRRGVLAERHPAIIRQVREAFPYDAEVRRALDELAVNCTRGALEPLPDEAHDLDRWRAWGLDGHLGTSWYDVPWLWSESYFYRQLLQAVGYFGPGVWQGVDPFRPMKLAELESAETEAELAALDDLAERSATERGRALLHGSLWGNRADLGFRLSDAGAEERAAVSGLVADDSDALWAALKDATVLCLVADNAGRELVPDLLFLAHLLTEHQIERAVLHVKPYPYYVSDATFDDVLDAVRALVAAPGAAGEFGRRLWAALSDGTLVVRAHPFSASPLPYADMPDDLRADFAGASVTVFKGDLNYRRLVGDRLWAPTTPFADVTAYFPGVVAALRTLKSDVITGLSAETEAALTASEGQGWRIGGTRALIQVRGV
ncbi:protein-glutamate O-methyltransferase family protein [Streptomyces roseirectus]|uniref:Protein-glutamate O-methyltransferase family protein n=1 Tax=Streptomyces roseirectus TaxID=2768066 RepID=A0A7H0I9Q3_9ACTN|nr:damage-control phosphatase ARMT1 family protein [Streptomyces roseirectus]QNP69519.1 protein-glutamate O-methyltransferase family protein [Streptomyces roseirectus]